MGFREIFTLDPSTIRAGRRCFNLLVRAIILGFTLALLLALNLSLNYLIELIAGPFGLDDRTRDLLSQGVLVFVIVVSVSAVLMSVMDVLTLVVVQMTGRDSENGREHSERPAEEESKPSSG